MTKYYFCRHLPADVTPEILRCPLEQAILKTKVLDLGDPKDLLGSVMDPSRLDNILTSITTLKEVGALFTGNRLPSTGISVIWAESWQSFQLTYI